MAPAPSDPVTQAMSHVLRADFLPQNLKGQAHEDRPLPLAPGSTSSQPTTVRRMLQALDVQPGQRALDVGSGSGWTSGLLGHLTGPDGEVLGVDLTDYLVDFAREALDLYCLPWVRIERAEVGVLGTPGRTWDRILVSADGGRIPETLVQQLTDGGRMVIPAAGRMAVVDRVRDRVHTRYLEGRWSFVALQ